MDPALREVRSSQRREKDGTRDREASASLSSPGGIFQAAETGSKSLGQDSCISREVRTYWIPALLGGWGEVRNKGTEEI